MSRKNYARLLCSAAVIALASGTAAFADDANFNIAPQSLDTALNAFSEQSAHPVLFKSDMALAKRTNGISGAADPEVALNQLLQGTGLSWKRAGDTFVITDASDPQSGSAAGDGAEAGTVQALIVTAQKREEDIQDVPIAMSAFSQEDLTRSQVAGGPDLMTQIPNMTFTKTNFNSYSIQIRGIGTQAISATTDPAVAVAFNNTPFVRNHFFEQEFYDLERVEVLRGPQGTLYGRNATAGVVNVISAKPKFRYEAKLGGDIANYNSTRLEGMINIPLVDDKVALRIAGAWTKREGFVKNTLTGDQTDGRDLWSGRVSLAVAPSDRFRADIIYEHFAENDDRLRSGKQLCSKDPGPAEINGLVPPPGGSVFTTDVGDFSQGCRAASLYSPDSFQTPNGFALPYYGAAKEMGSPVDNTRDPYVSSVQSRDLREIETHIKPEYTAKADLAELQMRLEVTPTLTLTSETAFSRDFIFSYEDYNRFDTLPGVFMPNLGGTVVSRVVDANGVFCDPQLGCTNRLAGADLATAKSQQFSQEFRLSSDMDGPLNFNFGTNFLRYDTEDKYYVFINSLTAIEAGRDARPWIPGVSDNAGCFEETNRYTASFIDMRGYAWSDPTRMYDVAAGAACAYVDPNDIHHLNDQGRNYFLSKNPYHLLSYSVFGEAYYNIAPDLKLTLGLRWTVDKKTAPQVPSWLLSVKSYGTPVRKVIEQEWREPTGRLAIDWRPALSFTDETLLYASYVRGYKAGGANPPPPIVVAPPLGGPAMVGFTETPSVTHPEVFDPEFVNAYEVGTKNTLLGGKMIVNLGAFYYDYSGYQISQIVNRSAVNLNFDATVWGLELETDWRPRENLRFGLKVGYEDTRLADGSSAVDLMDRTAGHSDWVLLKPVPPSPSNCIIPLWLATWNGRLQSSLCGGYLVGADPITGLPYVPNPDPSTYAAAYGPDYPGFDPSTAPNNGEGFSKDLSGNALPNAPHYTATVTADYTLPLPKSWLMTLHSDLYYQSEAWTRVFNTEGYDKLKAYSNINLAAIFSNEDAGWTVMAYVKNVLDRDSITGAFLNSDDSGLTTNVFLTEPRLYGLRVTKAWDGQAPLGSWFGGASDGPYPMRMEIEGYYGPTGHDHELFAPPTTDLFTSDMPFPFSPQKDLDWGAAGGAKFTYQPRPNGWMASAAVRYGRAVGDGEAHPKQRLPDVLSGSTVFVNFSDSANYYNYATTTAKNSESHAIADFTVGKEVGLGILSQSTFSAGLRHAHLESQSHVDLHGRPDFSFPTQFSEFFVTGASMHRVHGKLDADREFDGSGIVLAWDGAKTLFGNSQTGTVGVDFGLGGSVLFGKQKTNLEGEVHGDHIVSLFRFFSQRRIYAEPPYTHPIHETRSTSATVPSFDASLGLSYEVGRTKISGGYRWERFFEAIDGGIEAHKAYDRDIEGAFFKVSVGFGS